MTTNTHNHKVAVVIPAFNEENKIGKVVSSIPRGVVDKIIIIDDGSLDATATEASGDSRVRLIKNIKTEGVGSAIRAGINFAKNHNFSIVVIMAGNTKDDGGQIPLLVEPIIRGESDFVQGSRFLKKANYGHMPFYRLIATCFIHPVLFSMVSGKRISDSTNGFRAIRTAIFEDERINLDQEWLNRYELEPYLFYKVLKLGYRVREVPVFKRYPPKKLGYTKMRPFIDWWLILKPIFLLGLGIKK